MPRLLVIDDDTDLRAAVTEYLCLLGYEVHQTAEREEAKALVANYAYALVITDISLTQLGVEGFDLLRTISNSNSRPRLIVMSGHTGSGHRERARHCGADVFLENRHRLRRWARQSAPVCHCSTSRRYYEQLNVG